MVPVLVLAIIAVVIIKSLMSVVARNEGTTLPPWSIENGSPDLTVEPRAAKFDDARGFLLPAAPEPADAEPPRLTEPRAVTEQTRSKR